MMWTEEWPLVIIIWRSLMTEIRTMGAGRVLTEIGSRETERKRSSNIAYNCFEEFFSKGIKYTTTW